MSFNGLLYAQNLPETPGVYKMYGGDKLLYVGKAKNLRKRVQSYFSKNTEARVANMVRQITSINVLSVPTEIDALILESDLIKKENPKYNILLKDDRGYPYIYVSTESKFPQIEVHYKKKSGKKGRYFGPYPSRKDIWAAVSSLQSHFKLRTCDDVFFAARKNPCFQYQIKKCSGPCVGLIAEKEYKDDVSNLCSVLEGRAGDVVSAIVAKMKKASDKNDYEKAMMYRDEVSAIRHIQSRISVDSGTEDYECVSLSCDGPYGLGVVLFVRGGKISSTEHISFEVGLGGEEFSVEEIFLSRFLVKNPPLSGKIITTDLRADKSRVLFDYFKVSSEISSPREGSQKTHLAIAESSSKTALAAILATSDKKNKQFEDIVSLLGLQNKPERIECFDISHIQGQDTVGTKVSMGQKGPIKKEYRRYNLQDTNGDDLLAMSLTLKRRFSGLETLPDLLIIDGGHTQVNVAMDILNENKLSVPCFGISKGPERIEGEEILINGQTGEEIRPPRNSLGFQLIQSVRNEAHRFAIEGHRKKRAKRMVASALDDINGVGKIRRKKILQYFGGLDQLKLASVKQIEEVPGIGKDVAEKIYNLFHS